MRRRSLLLALVVALVLSASTPAHAAVDPGRDRQWALDTIGADAAGKVANGSGVTVAVVDSGVDLAHEDLAGKLVPGHDVVDGDDTPQDVNGHGTHVAGIIAATAGNGRGIAGAAPGARIMPVRVLDADGRGSVTDVIEGVRWAVAHGAKVVNLSLGEEGQSLLGPSLGDALREAWAAGVVPVVAAGAARFTDEPAIVVAATDRQDGAPSYSKGVGGAKWGMSAPGGEVPERGTAGAILSTWWSGDKPDQYAYLAGSSQAAPHVAAAVAVLLSTGRFTPEQAVQRLLDTAVDLGAPGRDPTFGAGRLDLAAAVGAPAPSPDAGPPATVAATTSTTTSVVPTTTLAPPPDPGATTSTTAPMPVSLARHRTDDGDRTLPATAAGVLIVLTAGATERQRRRLRR